MAVVEELWDKVRGWWTHESSQLTYAFLPDPAAPAAVPNGSYVRVWLSEALLAHDREHAVDRHPAVQASIRLKFAGSDGTTFTTLLRPEPGTEGPGARVHRLLSELVPFSGGTVELQVCLLDVAGQNHLALALDVLSGFTSLVTPPLSTVLTVAEKVASGVTKVDEALEASGARPALVLETVLASAAAGEAPGLRAGYHVVVRDDGHQVPVQDLRVQGGRLYRHDGGRLVALTGYDHLVVLVEVRAERDDWRFPEWDALIGQAQAAMIAGNVDQARALRLQVLSRIVQSPDLTPTDRRRVAKVVKDELDAFDLGAAGEERLTSVAELVGTRGLPSRAAAAALSIDELLA